MIWLPSFKPFRMGLRKQIKAVMVLTALVLWTVAVYGTGTNATPSPTRFSALFVRLVTIIIPETHFRQADPLDVLDSILKQSDAADHNIGTVATNQPSSPDVSYIVISRNDPERKALSAVTMSIRNITLLEAIDLITHSYGMRYEFRKSNIVIRLKSGRIALIK